MEGYTTDWQCGKSVTDRMLYMLEKELMCDVTILAGPDSTPIKAHKYMLASSSPVFYSMFEGPLAEKDTVTIPDIQPDIFRSLLKFVYSDHCKVDTDNLDEIMYASDKYMLDNLKDKCSKYLQSSISEENVFIMLRIAQKFDLNKAVKRCLGLICQKKKMIQSQDFAFLPHEYVKKILQCRFLLCKEEIIYDAAIRWATERCKEKDIEKTDENVREILGELLYLIRFPKMDPTYFAKEISTKNILSKEEIIQVYQSHHSITMSTFCSVDRLPEFDMFYRCSTQNRNITTSMWLDDDEPHMLEFKTNKDVFLKKVVYFVPKKFHGEFKYVLSIHQKVYPSLSSTSTYSSRMIYKDETKLIPSEARNTTCVNDLKCMLKIEKEVTYIVELLTIAGLLEADIYAGKNYKSVVTQDGVTVTFINSKSVLRNEYTDISKGQIAGIGLAQFEI